ITHPTPGLFGILVWDVFQNLDPADRDWWREDREKQMGRLEDYKEGREERAIAFRPRLEPLRLTLAEQPFLCGESPAYADYIVFGEFQWARCISQFDLIETDDPIFEWRERILDLFDGFARAAPRRDTPSRSLAFYRPAQTDTSPNMTNSSPLILADDGRGASATRPRRQFPASRRALYAPFHDIGTTAMAQRTPVAGKTVLSHSQPCRRVPYGESRLKSWGIPVKICYRYAPTPELQQRAIATVEVSERMRYSMLSDLWNSFALDQAAE
ncbi:MAG TPA: hypothetical protein QF804_04825, partial [Rhodospirillales bacterium]|nr:hypothetical protein [Rhodospirillales bacterium]